MERVQHIVDWELVQAEAQRLCLFDQECGLVSFGIEITSLAWRPASSDLGQGLDSLMTWWDGIASDRSLPDHRAIDAFALRPWLGTLMVLEPVVEDDRADFRMRLYGSKIAGRSGYDLTSLPVSEIAFQRNYVHFALATYGAAYWKGEPVEISHVPPHNVPFSSWRRLILPFGGAAGVTRLLVGNVIDNRRDLDLERLWDDIYLKRA